MNDAFIAKDSLIMSKNRDQNPDENQLNMGFVAEYYINLSNIF